MFWKREPTLLEKEIDRAIRELSHHEVTTEQYEKTLVKIVQLSQVKEEDKSKPVSKDTLAIAITNLLGIFMVVRHEHVNVITSRAMNLLLKPITRS